MDKEDLYQEYLEDLSQVGNAKDELFPDFLFNLETNYFDGEDYYSQGIAESPLLKEAKKIRRKYSDYFDFQDALEAYDTYMKLLAEKYGYYSAKAVSKAAKNGMIEDYVPPKPRLKNSRKNRTLAMSGMVPSRKVVPSASQEELLALSRSLMPNADGSNTDDLDIKSKPTKEIRKIFEEASDRVGGMERRKNMYRRSGTNSDIDFILNYINETTRGNFSTRDYSSNEDRPLSEIVKELKIEETIPEPLLEEYLSPNTTTIVNGQIRDSRKEKDIEVMKLLYESGVDIFGTYGKNMSKESVKMVRHAVGATGPMTKKEQKQFKKRQKAEQKRMTTKRQNDAIMERALMRNRYSFDKGDGVMSFTLSDLFGK